MRRLVLSAAVVLGSSVVVLAQASDARPQFRTGIDVIRLDISVLDRSGAPVHGLKAPDFTVLENGKPQQLIAVSEIDDAVLNPTPSAQMRYARRDVAANDLSELATTGRLVAIVIDDHMLPFDDVDIAMSARAAARRIVDDSRPGRHGGRRVRPGSGQRAGFHGRPRPAPDGHRRVPAGTRSPSPSASRSASSGRPAGTNARSRRRTPGPNACERSRPSRASRPSSRAWPACRSSGARPCSTSVRVSG